MTSIDSVVVEVEDGWVYVTLKDADGESIDGVGYAASFIEENEDVEVLPN